MDHFEYSRRIALLNTALEKCGFQPTSRIYKHINASCSERFTALVSRCTMGDEMIDLIINGIIISLIRRGAYYMKHGKTGDYNEMCLKGVKRAVKARAEYSQS